AAQFVVNLEIRASDVSPHADVVFPVAPVTDKAGSFVDWEGRVRTFDNVFRNPGSLPDLRVLAGIAEEMGTDLGFRTVEQAREEMAELGPWDGERVAAPSVPAGAAPSVPAGDASGAPNQLRSSVAPPPDPSTVAPDASSSAPSGAADGASAAGDTAAAGHYVLATWKLLVDDGRMLDGDEYLKATGRRAELLVSQGALRELGVAVGQMVTVAGERGSVELPVGVADLPEGVVWLPTNSGGISLSRDLGAGAGSVVRLEGGRA
ncbi:MAG: molybdopterin dinucleotide binding domain-containing protein, partial [Nocardioidaceae bacterium]